MNNTKQRGMFLLVSMFSFFIVSAQFVVNANALSLMKMLGLGQSDDAINTYFSDEAYSGMSAALQSFLTKIFQFGDMVSSLALAISAVTLTILAIRALIGSEKDMEALKKGFVAIIIGIFLINAIPVLVMAGVNIGYQYGFSTDQFDEKADLSTGANETGGS